MSKTSIDLDTLKALLADATTEGPWGVEELRCDDKWVVFGGTDAYSVGTVWSRTDADLIAAARNALPALLDELTKTRAELDEARNERTQVIYRLTALRFQRDGLLAWAAGNLGSSLIHKRIREHFGLPVDPATMSSPEVHALANPATTAEPANTVWDNYAPCTTCGAVAGKPCVRVNVRPGHYRSKPHWARELAATTAEPAARQPITSRWPRIPGNDTVALHDCGGDPKCCGTPGDHDEAEPADEQDDESLFESHRLADGTMPDTIPVSDPEHDAPDGATIDGYTRQRNTWVRNAEPADEPKATACNGNCIYHLGEVVVEDLCCPLHGIDAEPAAS